MTNRSSKTQVTVITGASSGIGAEFARHYGALGHNLLLIARREEKLNELQAELKAAGAEGDIQYIKADLAEPGAAQKIAGEMQVRGLTTKILINNAAVAIQTQFNGESAATWLGHIQLNIMSFVDITRTLLPQLIESKGKVLNIASLSSFQPIPYFAIYAACKSFMLSLSESLAFELAPYGVGVTCVSPGAVRTEFNTNAGMSNDFGPSFLWMNPNQVVKKSAKAFAKGKRVYIPGWINKLNVFGQRFVPRSLVVRMAGNLYKQMNPVNYKENTAT